MKAKSWFVPFGLLVLLAAPLVGGVLRLADIAHPTAVNSENARFLSAPWPIFVHVICASLYGVLGAFQFSSELRRRSPQLHRGVGKVLVLAAFSTAVTGIWMTAAYQAPTRVITNPQPAQFDGAALTGMRLIVGAVMLVFLMLAIAAIRNRNFPRHGEWMIRSYALAAGAGTQAFTHIPWFLFPALHSENARTIFMGLGWLINLVVAEWIIGKTKSTNRRT